MKKRKFVSEDVEIFKLGKTMVVCKVDTLVQSTDIPPRMKFREVARKSIVSCVSDFAAKSVRPQFGIISINLPKNLTRSNITEIANGIARGANEFKITMLGGDTNEGNELVLTVCLFGTAKEIVKRRGAKPGEAIFATGPFGYTSSGLQILLGKKRANDIFRKKALKSVLNPCPRLDFGIKNGKYFTSSMDSSDGLSTTLIEMANQSKCKFLINNIPTQPDVLSFGKTNKLDVERLVFDGGEEFEIIFTAKEENIRKIKNNSVLLKIPIIRIGNVCKGSGVFIEKDQKVTRIKDRGWRHFRRK